MGLKQVDVSELTGIKRVTLAAYEKERILPPLEKLKALAEVYNIDVTDLVKETIMPDDVSVIKSSAGALRQTSLQSERELDEFLYYYNRLEDKHKVAVFNVTKTLYMDSV